MFFENVSEFLIYLLENALSVLPEFFGFLGVLLVIAIFYDIVRSKLS